MMPVYLVEWECQGAYTGQLGFPEDPCVSCGLAIYKSIKSFYNMMRIGKKMPKIALSYNNQKKNGKKLIPDPLPKM